MGKHVDKTNYDQFRMDSKAIKEKHLGISRNKRGKLTFDIE